MFCPECGQQQISDEARFCSRCGFQLAGVTGLLATRGALPADATPAALAPETPRRKGVRQGAKLFLIGLFLIPLLAIFYEMSRGLLPEELPLAGVIVFVGGLLRMIYAALFEDGPYRRQPASPFAYAPPAAQPLSAPRPPAAELPPARGVPARGYAAPRADTGEISYRPSVTEGTTRLLDEQDDQPGR
ncbi:MAG TPA: zinc ribbon domain-containing protein [Pyrinomonadaceae bacterium]|nr:zinc ribbon domain-containing protein [Pyrinomonadaceae bacterium]